MEYSDHDLVRGVKRGDREALSLLVRRWYPRVYGYCFKLTAHEQDAYDITQDVFLAVLQHIEGFHLWKSFGSWLFTIAHNKCMDYFRMRKKAGPIQELDAELADPAPAPEELVILSSTVDRAVSQLPKPQQDVILLHYFRQLTCKEIAQMTRTPLPTVKSRLGAAKKTLSKLLWEDFQ